MDSPNIQSLSNEDLNRYLVFMVEFLDLARSQSRAFWDNPTPTVIKEDKSPVTELDRSLESQFRDRVAKQFPAHGVIGEEYGNSNLSSEFQWIVDPIDGTMNLVNRIPTFGTLLALSFRGVPILGAIDHPLLDIRYYGGEGIGVFDQVYQKLSPYGSLNRTLETVMIGAEAPSSFNRVQALPLLEKLVHRIPNLRIYYDCFAHSMTVSGAFGAHVACGLKIWDVAAAIALVRGRGGVARELGEPWSGDPSQRVSFIFGERWAANALYDFAIASFPDMTFK